MILLDNFDHNSDLLGYSDRIYDPALTLYSVAAHFLAVTAGITESIETYRRGAALAHLALNLSPEHFGAIKFPDAIEAASKGAINAFRSTYDVGAAFAAMVWAAPKDTSISMDV